MEKELKLYSTLVLAAILPTFAFATTEQIQPVIRKGEVKISYPCNAFASIPTEAEKEVITFYDSLKAPGSLDLKGIIIRTRKSAESDATIKYRPKTGNKILLDKVIYDQMSASQTADLKCESDVTYEEDGFKNVESCSVTTDTESLNENHELFLKMVGVSGVSLDLKNDKRYDIDSIGWKIKNPLFAKGISVEKWEMIKGEKTLCILETSAKFEVKKDPVDSIPTRMEAEFAKGFANLRAAFPGQIPDSVQGNKTGRALGFLKAP